MVVAGNERRPAPIAVTDKLQRLAGAEPLQRPDPLRSRLLGGRDPHAQHARHVLQDHHAAAADDEDVAPLGQLADRLTDHFVIDLAVQHMHGLAQLVHERAGRDRRIPEPRRPVGAGGCRRFEPALQDTAQPRLILLVHLAHALLGNPGGARHLADDLLVDHVVAELLGHLRDDVGGARS